MSLTFTLIVICGGGHPASGCCNANGTNVDVTITEAP